MPIRVVLVQAFWSKTALVDGMLGVPAYGNDLRAGDADFNAAPNRANTARRRHPPFNLNRLVLLRKTP
jgi:hypothetical protein